MIVRIRDIQPHPNAEKLDVIKFPAPFPTKEAGARHVQVVAGKHYQSGAHGEAVWFQPGAILPGWLAEELWMSEGLIAGRYWRKTTGHEFELWRFWKQSWHPGEDVSDHFGVWFPRPLSSAAEQLVANQQVAARQGALGASPAAGSK